MLPGLPVPEPGRAGAAGGGCVWLGQGQELARAPRQQHSSVGSCGLLRLPGCWVASNLP